MQNSGNNELIEKVKKVIELEGINVSKETIEIVVNERNNKNKILRLEKKK